MPPLNRRRGSRSYRRTTRALKATTIETKETKRKELTETLTIVMEMMADAIPAETIMRTKQDRSTSQAKFKTMDSPFPKSNSPTTTGIAETRM